MEPQRKMKKKSKRKHPVYAHYKFNKGGLINAFSSFSNSIIAGSYKRKVKDLLINNEALARALEEANYGIAIRENTIIGLMRTASNTRLIRTKAREVAGTVHKLNLEMFELMSCIDDAIDENEKTMSMLKENENNPNADLRTKSVKPQGNFDHNATAAKSYTQIDAIQAAKRVLQENNASTSKDLTIITEVSTSANTSVLLPVLFEENSNGSVKRNRKKSTLSSISIQEDASKSSNVETRKRKQVRFALDEKKDDSKPSKEIESESHNGAAATDVREQDIVAPLQVNEVCDLASTAPTLNEAFIRQNKKRKVESDKNEKHVKPASKVNTDSIPRKTKKSIKPKTMVTMEKQDNILDKPEAETRDLVEVHKEDQIRKSEQKPSTSAATSTLRQNLKKFRMLWRINDSITELSAEDCESQATPPPPLPPPSQPEELGRRSHSQSTASVMAARSKDSNDMNRRGLRNRANTVVSYKEPRLNRKMCRE